MSDITPIVLPTPIEWDTVAEAAAQHILALDGVFANPQNIISYHQALVEVCLEIREDNRSQVAQYWMPYMYNRLKLKDFFTLWLTYTPTTADPGLYIEYWDYLANTPGGLTLINDDAFRPWFSTFLNFHGDWINSTSSTGTLADWMTYPGTDDHPFDINDYIRPDPDSPTGGFLSFNQFFLRNLKGDQRPLGDAVVVAPCDGGVFFLDRGGDSVEVEDGLGFYYDLPGKSDHFHLLEALPGYGRHFLGGPLLDILLWFTDYHHFHAPVAGTVIDQGLYRGSYNYDFGDYNPETHYAPELPPESDRVGWYEELGKHQRYVWIIKTEELGLVAMVAIGFWGVGSIENAVETGASLEQGQYMGHFGYEGSSIVLAFEPGMDLTFEVNGEPVNDPDHPVLMKVRASLATQG